jgi:hypothetical protein
MKEDSIKSSEELRQYGYTMALMCFVFAIVSLWKRDFVFSNASIILSVLGGIFTLFALVAPLKLQGVEIVWMKFGEKISSVMTPVILSLTFFIIITPIGLLMRLFGKDLLQLKVDRASKSYWAKVEPDGPASRPYAPY